MNDLLTMPIFSEALSFIALVALAGVAVLALVLVAEWTLRNRSDSLRYGILFLGAIALLAVPALVAIGMLNPVVYAPLPEGEPEVVHVSVDAVPRLLEAPPLPIDDEPIDQNEEPSFVAPIAGLSLSGIWLIGCIVGVCRLALALWKQNRTLDSEPWQPAFWTPVLQAQLGEKLGLREFPPVHVAPTVPMPMVAGLWRPTIVLPAHAPANWTQAQWEAILLHEAAHIARHDQWAALAQRLAVCLFWWCPLVYLLNRKLNDLRENICDDYALQGPCDQIGYAELLVESAERLVNCKAPTVSVALLDSAHGGLEARITRLLAKEKQPMSKLTLSGKLLGGALLVAACLLTTAATAFSQAQAQPTPQKKVQIKIVVDGKEIDLTDAQILPLIEAAQQKAAQDDVIKFKVKIAPDGDGKKDIFIEKKVIALPVQPGFIVPVQVDDPRIEALVKQAEAIKPGSGAEVRRALQGQPAAGVRFPVADPKLHDLIKKHVGDKKVDAVGGKPIIIVVQDGKVREISGDELRKMIEKGGMSFPVPLPPLHGVPATPKFIEKKAVEDIYWYAKPMTPRTDTKPAPMPAPADIESLRRQLDRITAELQDLRKQLKSKQE